jgi:hypothetical protein
MKQLLLALAGSIILSPVFAQSEYSSFTATGRGGATTFVTDYQAVGINPAGVAMPNIYGKKFAMGYSEFTFSMHSSALTKDELRTNMRALILGDTTDPFTQEEKINAAKSFTDEGFAINGDLGSFGFSYNSEKFGGIAFRINDRFQWYSKLGQTASEILFLGFNAPYFESVAYLNGLGDTVIVPNNPNMDPDSLQNVLYGFANVPNLISDILDGSVMSMSWMREYNLSYGRKIIGKDSTFAIFGGIGIKYFQGMAYLDVRSEGGTLDAFSSISPVFDIDYGTAAQTNPSTITQSGNFPKPVGHGFGFDFGVNVLIGGKLKIGAALTNIGSMTWDGNVYTMRDTLIFDTDNPGLENYNILGNVKDIAGEDGLFVWNGEESRKVNLPTTFRFGASLRIGKIAEIGFDAIVPVNDEAANFQKTVFGFGGDISPIKWVRFSAGFLTGGNYDFQVPVGITFIGRDGKWEGGVASRDAVTFFTQNGPTLSLSMGFLRFRF